MSLPVYRNPELPIDERIADLIGQLTLEEKCSLLRYDSPAIERLGIPEYNWWNEALHGVGAGRQGDRFSAGDRHGGHFQHGACRARCQRNQR
jgi:hypothetical protein